jgi:hypothetical protein
MAIQERPPGSGASLLILQKTACGFNGVWQGLDPWEHAVAGAGAERYDRDATAGTPAMRTWSFILFTCHCGCGKQFVVPEETRHVSLNCPSSGARVRVSQCRPFTEQHWAACTDLSVLLGCFVDRPVGRSRKQQLFACACLRRMAHLLTDASRRLLESYERRVEGEGSREDWARARALATEVARDLSPARPRDQQAAYHVAYVVTRELAYDAFWAAAHAGRDIARWVGAWALAAESKAQCDLFRDLFGSPFRRPRLDDAWLAWNNGTVPKLAQAIYDERRFGDLPVLADALEDAGCDDAELLGHCRAPGEHVRGCWVVDAILGWWGRSGCA